MKTVNDTRERDKACLVEVIPASLWVEHGWVVSIVTEVASGHQSITSVVPWAACHEDPLTLAWGLKTKH